MVKKNKLLWITALFLSVLGLVLIVLIYNNFVLLVRTYELQGNAIGIFFDLQTYIYFSYMALFFFGIYLFEVLDK